MAIARGSRQHQRRRTGGSRQNHHGPPHGGCRSASASRKPPNSAPTRCRADGRRQSLTGQRNTHRRRGSAWRFGATTPAQFRHIHTIAIWTAWIIFSICVAIMPTADFLGDWRWIRRWRQAPFESNGNDVTAWLDSLHTRRATERMITILTRRQPTSAAIQIQPSMYELRGTLEWVKEVSPSGKSGKSGKSRMREDILTTVPSYLKPNTKKWIRRYDRRYPGRLNSIANSQGTAINDYVVALDQLH